MSSKAGGAKASRKQDGIKVVADNRRARFDYEIMQTFEAGVEHLDSIGQIAELVARKKKSAA